MDLESLKQVIPLFIALSCVAALLLIFVYSIKEKLYEITFICVVGFLMAITSYYTFLYIEKAEKHFFKIKSGKCLVNQDRIIK